MLLAGIVFASYALAMTGIVAVLARRSRRASGRSVFVAWSRPRSPFEAVGPLLLLGYPIVYLAGTLVPDAAPFRPLRPPGLANAIGGALLLAANLALYAACVRTMDRSWRVGLDPDPALPLVTTGIYARVRHPIYASILLGFAGGALLLPTPFSVGALLFAAAGLAAQARVEERWCSSKYGEAYRAYRARTGGFIPRLRR